MELTSPEFNDGDPIPRTYTCDGEDASPPLRWSDVPDNTATLALTCEDPDAPGGTFVHWVLWGVDPTPDDLAEGETPAGAVQGRNGFGKSGYGGPCPPPGHGTHHYHFTLYALSEAISLGEGASIDELRGAMEGKVLAHAELVGTYER